MSGDDIELDPKDENVRRVLWKVLIINFLQVFFSGAIGLYAHSTALLGTALDNLGDSAVYMVSLYAVGRTLSVKVRAAKLSGILLLLLGIMLFIEVIRRFTGTSEPIGIAIMITAVINAAINLINLRLLEPHKKHGVHLSASWIFTGNDMLVNASIVFSGALVIFFKSAIPDLIVSLVIVLIVFKSGAEILKDAKKAESEPLH